MRVGGLRHASAALPREREPVPILQEAGLAPVPVWIRSPDRTARRGPLYRLRYPGPLNRYVGLYYTSS
jgi:hypothetical protein